MPAAGRGIAMVTRKPEQPFELGSQAAPGDRSPEARGSYDQRANRILAAATAIIARDGYQKASMRAIANASGVSLAGLYHYFDSKQRMLFVIQFRTFSSLLNNLQEKLHGVDDPIEQLQVMVKAHVAYFASNMPALKVCSHELDSLSGSAYDETHRIRREYYSLTRSIVDRILRAAAPDSSLDRGIAAMSLFGTLNWLYRWYDPKHGRSPSVLADQIATQFLHGVLGAAGVSSDSWQESVANR